jgi:hypothetical protein
MYAHVTVKQIHTPGSSKQYINAEKEWGFKGFLYIFNFELSIIRRVNLYSKLLNISLPVQYSVYFPENTSGFKLVYGTSKMASHVLCDCGALATL